MMALNISQWVTKAIEKLWRVLLWQGQEANGGHCLLAWSKVCMPMVTQEILELHNVPKDNLQENHHSSCPCHLEQFLQVWDLMTED